jgi:mono/diheme cytochrome c family protein
MKRTPAIVVLAVVLALSGCSGKKSSTPDDRGAVTASTSASKLDTGPRAAEAEIGEEMVEQGEQLFKDKGCSACHTFGRRLTGPDLAGVSQRRTARWIESQILHPEVMTKEDPISRQLFAEFALQMPNQGLTEAQAKAIVEYFKHQDHESAERH